MAFVNEDCIFLLEFAGRIHLQTTELHAPSTIRLLHEFSFFACLGSGLPVRWEHLRRDRSRYPLVFKLSERTPT